jgi:hypothetical protein
MERYELTCRYDSRNSFYGKAWVKETEEEQDLMIYTILELYSYGTLVARITKNNETCLSTCEYLGKYSQTTTRHQKEFFKQFGLSDEEIKELFKNGILEVR